MVNKVSYSAIDMLYGMKIFRGELKESQVPEIRKENVKAYIKELEAANKKSDDNQ